jgi:hypothetical protein
MQDRTRNATAPAFVRAALFNILAALHGGVINVCAILVALSAFGLIAGALISHGHPPMRFMLTTGVLFVAALAIGRVYERLLWWLSPDRPA